LSTSDMTEPKQKEAIENKKIIAKSIFLIIPYYRLGKTNR